MIQVIGQATQSNGGSPSWTLSGVCKSASRTADGTYTVTIDYLGAFGIDSKDKLTILVSAERGNLGTERYILDWTSANTFRVRNYTARNNQTLGDCILTITILADVNPIRLGFSGNTLIFPQYKFFDVTTADGYIVASNTAGYPGELNVLSGVPMTSAYKCSGFGITGAALTGNEFKYENRNVSAEALFEHYKDLTLVPNDHGTLSADKMTGFSGDIVTVNAIPDEGWYFTGMNVTGATFTGNKFMFVGENVTAEGLYTDEGFPIVYENDGHGTLTGDTDIGIPGQPITLTTSYNTYYRFSGYEVTGGYIEDGKLYATAQCTAKAIYKPNAFTASGGYDKGSNLSINSPGSTKYTQTNYLYATASYKTSNVPAAWYSTSNRWKVTSEVSGYKITMNPRMTFYGRTDSNSNQLAGYATGLALIGNTQTQSQSYSTNSQSQQTWNYNKTFTSNTTGVNYGCSGRIGAKGTAGYYYGYANYNASLTTGTWTATGVLP